MKRLWLVLGFTAVFMMVHEMPVWAMKAVLLGDSTTAGTPGFRSPLESPPDGRGNPESQYGYWLGLKLPGWKFLNRGVNGERTDQILNRFERDVAAENPDLVVVMAGVNDLYQGRGVAEVTENLTRIYAKAREMNIRVLACTILPYNSMRPEIESRMKKVNEWIREYASANGMLFCDAYGAAEHPARPGKLAESPDGLHPGPDTYRKIGEAIASVLEQNGKEGA